MTMIEPRHDAPPCKCGEGLLVPVAYDEGMSRPVAPEAYMAQVRHVRCTSTGSAFYVGGLQAAQAWWSVGAYEQRLVDEVEIARLNAEAEVQSRENTRLRELLAGQGVLDLGEPAEVASLHDQLRLAPDHESGDEMKP